MPAVLTEEIVAADEFQLARARRGDADAFVSLLGEADLAHRRLAYRLLGDRARVDDVLQDAYVKAFRGLSRFSGRASLATWLYRIVYNACLDELRRRRGRDEVSLEEWSGSSPDRADRADERLDLAAALAALPPELRAAVLLVDAEGLSYEEAAEALGLAPGTVASRLSRARSELRRALDPREEGTTS